jgi:type I restriction enzyme R subunit
LQRFKSDLGKFERYYAYISQLINLGDADLENFADFCKLLAKRLDGVPVEEVDISGLILRGYDIVEKVTQGGEESGNNGGEDEDNDDLVLQPILGTKNGELSPRQLEHLHQNDF